MKMPTISIVLQFLFYYGCEMEGKGKLSNLISIVNYLKLLRTSQGSLYISLRFVPNVFNIALEIPNNPDIPEYLSWKLSYRNSTNSSSEDYVIYNKDQSPTLMIDANKLRDGFYPACVNSNLRWTCTLNVIGFYECDNLILTSSSVDVYFDYSNQIRASVEINAPPLKLGGADLVPCKWDDSCTITVKYTMTLEECSADGPGCGTPPPVYHISDFIWLKPRIYTAGSNFLMENIILHLLSFSLELYENEDTSILLASIQGNILDVQRRRDETDGREIFGFPVLITKSYINKDTFKLELGLIQLTGVYRIDRPNMLRLLSKEENAVQFSSVRIRFDETFLDGESNSLTNTTTKGLDQGLILAIVIGSLTLLVIIICLITIYIHRKQIKCDNFVYKEKKEDHRFTLRPGSGKSQKLNDKESDNKVSQTWGENCSGGLKENGKIIPNISMTNCEVSLTNVINRESYL